jgi:hypothetical protein
MDPIRPATRRVRSSIRPGSLGVGGSAKKTNGSPRENSPRWRIVPPALSTASTASAISSALTRRNPKCASHPPSRRHPDPSGRRARLGFPVSGPGARASVHDDRTERLPVEARGALRIANGERDVRQPVRPRDTRRSSVLAHTSESERPRPSARRAVPGRQSHREKLRRHGRNPAHPDRRHADDCGQWMSPGPGRHAFRMTYAQTKR